jgi:hypothetical protein
MSEGTEAWIAKHLAAKIDWLRQANHLTQQQLRRSYEQIALSEKLLKLAVPKVWHPEPPSNRRGAPAAERDRVAGRADQRRTTSEPGRGEQGR